MTFFFERIPSRRERFVRYFTRWFDFYYVRQTKPFYRLTMWWLNRQRECEMCDGTGCPCMRWRDWQSMELGCECGCGECGRRKP